MGNSTGKDKRCVVRELTDYCLTKIEKNGTMITEQIPELTVKYNSGYRHFGDINGNRYQVDVSGTINSINLINDDVCANIGAHADNSIFSRNIVNSMGMGSFQTNNDGLYKLFKQEEKVLRNSAKTGTSDPKLCDRWIAFLKKYFGLTDDHLDASKRYDITTNKKLQNELLGDNILVTENAFLKFV